MSDCIFCKIASGEAPSHTIYEDENYKAFLNITPSSKGHTLVIPKKHVRWVHDVEPFGEYWETALKVKNILDQGLQPEWTGYLTHGAIHHAHIHVIPRYDDVHTSPVYLRQTEKPLPQEELERLAQKILSRSDN